ncbi:trans-cinnamate:CoA ligase, peroxisomal [Elaeis guineensis]|uniref:4-coumarate--CoA ligase n=1 Tax=Elaeis guineensis var. tenera TaxID=51953 RepID=A0A6I9SBG1_ELAGV|nr:benzoate--CoA ligase, peroxisomal [Elaeis guineensis]
MDQLPKCQANYAPVTPITFLERAALVYSDRTSIVFERIRFTWKQTYDRCRRMASSLRSLNVSKNDVVSVLAPNIPAMYEMHFAVPMAGAVLNTINSRLDAPNVATILKHSEAKVFFVDYEYIRLASDALKHLIDDDDGNVRLPLVVVIDDIAAPTGIRLGELEYEDLIASGDPLCPPCPLNDEWDPIALNYTSGTTSAPKGVVYSHRGAFLSTLSLLLQWEVGSEPVYLWSLPMFHCNGWTFTWGMAARGGANVCIRATTAREMYRAIADHRVTHMCCAPIVFNILLNATPAERRPLPTPVSILTGGAPPPAPLLEKIQRLGFRVTHAYGLTEATGPALVCEWRQEWNHRPVHDQARLKSRQGISVLTLADVDVKDVQTMRSVPRDGISLGEIVLRGSSIMKGYYKNRAATDAAFKDGWFLTGDVGVIHPDGYVEIKDRSKDVIISGGENISSVEVETILYRHPMVLEAAVVAMPHPHWGETPCAFLTLKRECEQGTINEEDIISYCRNSMSRFMVPKKVVFMEELPKTSTGKIQKFLLRETARGLKVTDRNRTPQGGAAPQGDAQVVYANGNNGHGQPEAREQVLALSRL